MKKFIFAFMSMVLIVQMFCITAFAANETASPKHIPRVVSVVFDDSGSMYNKTDRWAYASYAMQAFSAIMGEEDVLHITYLNGASDSKELSLSKADKQKSIDKFENTMFGGGTPNKLSKGADCLIEDYKKYKNNAKYYLVVMADGALDDNMDMTTELSKVNNKTKDKLGDADFETIYFSMKGELNIPGVDCRSAKTGNEIINVLRSISSDIMGRTTVDCSNSDGKLTFELKYPALSIAVFAQKTNSGFSNIQVPVTYNGKKSAYNVETYYLDSPKKINKNLNATVNQEKMPENPPYGFVSLISNGKNSVPKGTYTIDLSAYNLKAKDIIVLVEPAVRVDCKYYIGDSETAVSFEELKKNVYADDTIRIQCGLYEINADGSSGDAVPLDVLSPKYKLYVSGSVAGEKISGTKNEYQLTIDKSYSSKELKIEATLKGYQPFVLREKFGEIKVKPVFDSSNSSKNETIRLTKPQWKNWQSGDYEIEFPLQYADNSMLSEMSIKVEGADFLKSGKCSELENVSIRKNTIVFTPEADSAVPFDSLPESFRVSLWYDRDNTVVSSVAVNVIKPQYKWEIANDLEGERLNLDSLKTNSKGVKFTLCADYDNSGNFAPVDNSIEPDLAIALNKGVLTGNVIEDKNELIFVPVYDVNSESGISPDDIVGKDHQVSATAKLGGAEVTSEDVILSVVNVGYKITVDNSIADPLTLDSIKNNRNGVTFSVLADYLGDGVFGPVEEWDSAIFDKLEIDSGSLPGEIKKEYNITGKQTGVTFIPVYDEHNNNGIPFTEVSGKVHSIVAALSKYDVSAETTVEVLPPIYKIEVQKEDLKFIDMKILNNEQGVEFVVLRNDRPLTKTELEGFAPYNVSFGKEQKWLTIECVAEEGYLICKPAYDGWTFISPVLWNWISLLTVKKGADTINLTVGEETADADISIGISIPGLIILLIIIGILLLILWILFCFFTRVKFTKGNFYRVALKPMSNNLGYTYKQITKLNTGKGALKRFIFSGKFLVPFSLQTRSLTCDSKKALFLTKKVSGVRDTFPYSDKSNAENFNRGHLSHVQIEKLVIKDKTFNISSNDISGSACGREDMKMAKGTFLVAREANANTIIFFLSKKEEKTIKDRRKNRMRIGRKKVTDKRKNKRKTPERKNKNSKQENKYKR